MNREIPPLPQSIPLKLLGLGRGWLAVDKPAGLSVHNDPNGQADLLGILKAHLTGDKKLKIETGWSDFLSPAHRLDRETSGAIVLATRSEAASHLQTAFQERKVRKVYRAILRGVIEDDSGVWSQPLSDRAEGRKNPAGAKNERKDAESRFTVLGRSEHATEVQIELITGRQHQIRRHAVLSGHAVLGDLRYGDTRHAALMEKIYQCSRLYLHSWLLELPYQSATISLEAPVPPEFERIVQKA